MKPIEPAPATFMTTPTLFGLRSCDTCRKARRWLEANGIDFIYHDVRADGLDAALLNRWFDTRDWQDFINRQSLTWRKIPEVDRAGMDRERAVAAALEYATLIKRPVLERGGEIEIGFSPARYNALFADR